MSEKIIVFDSINPVELFGPNNSRLKIIRSHFPKIKIVDRGSELKLNGDEEEIEKLREGLVRILKHYERYGSLEDEKIHEILTRNAPQEETEHEETGKGKTILVGNDGLLVKARTPNQQLLIQKVSDNDMVFAIGPAGTGKTYTAVALAVKALKNKEIRRIILTRPAVEAGENLGFLPGDLKEKLDPYLQPLYDALRDMIPPEKLKLYMESGIIQIAPLAYMRGRTLDNAFVILDEAQNATKMQMKMFLTRMGQTAKFVITGDLTQVDLPRNRDSGLQKAMTLLKDVKGIGFVHFNKSDVIRHKLVQRILEVYEKDEAQNADHKDDRNH
ncbi:MAG: PhoH family protein [Flavobacteriales bacterium]|nr:PhoH family protein [Flavobacteriales bacterium]